MNIYRISQSVNGDYDTYSDAVVLAEDAQDARYTHPDADTRWDADVGTWLATWENKDDIFPDYPTHATRKWASPDDVTVEFLGTADPVFVEKNGSQSRVIVASFHAG